MKMIFIYFYVDFEATEHKKIFSISKIEANGIYET